LAGGVVCREGAFVGLGAVVIQGRTVGRHAVVGAGAVVVRDVADGTTVVGNPARPVVRLDPRPGLC
jgi:acetyltransferase EpsM